MKPRVLITSVGRKVSLVKAFHGAGWLVVGHDADPDAVALRFSDYATSEPLMMTDDFYDLIVPTRDAELLCPQPVCGRWLAPSLKTAEICTDKFKFYKFCKEHGFKTPEVYFVKPRVSASGKETECVWQELVEGEEYSVDLFTDFVGNVISIVPRKRIKIVSGESWVSETVENLGILSSAKSLAESLGLIGHNVLQLFLKDNEIIWTDVNCRFGGASALAIRAGCNSPLWLKDLIQGREVKPRIGEYEVGLRMLRHTEDFYERKG